MHISFSLDFARTLAIAFITKQKEKRERGRGRVGSDGALVVLYVPGMPPALRTIGATCSSATTANTLPNRPSEPRTCEHPPSHAGCPPIAPTVQVCDGWGSLCPGWSGCASALGGPWAGPQVAHCHAQQGADGWGVAVRVEGSLCRGAMISNALEGGQVPPLPSRVPASLCPATASLGLSETIYPQNAGGAFSPG